MRRLTLMLVGTMSMMSAGVFALACSSDPAVIPPPGDDDDDDVSSSGNGGSSGASGTSGGGTSSSGGTSSGGSSGTQGCFQTALRPSDKGPFCPFLPKASDPTKVGENCAAGQTCCNGRTTGTQGQFDPSSCVASPDDCPAPTNPATPQVHAYQCLENNDCGGGTSTGDAGADGGGTGGGQICCYIKFPDGDDLSEFENDNTCHAIKNEFGTRCKPACEAGELQACQANSDCGAGKTCKIAVSGPGGRIHGGVCGN